MDFNWTSYVGGFWIFPLLCLLFMAIMMIVCRGMRSGCGHCGPVAHKPEEGHKS